jgi:NAD(P)-dependent dehydrogenase (short-subunit alcohol dehydrogenase family)
MSPTSDPVPTATLGFEAGDLVVVTGAGSGIGRATAIAAAAMGLDVAAWDIDESTARRTATDIDATPACVDVTNADDVARGLADLGRPARYLVNNAGPPSATPQPFADGLVRGAGSVELVTRLWLDTQPPERAAVVNVASIAGNLLGSEPGWYSATKAAIGGYTRHLAVKHAGRLRANAVAPGMIATSRSKSFAASEQLQRALARNPIGRMGEPEEVAWAILFLLSPRAGYVNGVVLTVDGGWTIAP